MTEERLPSLVLFKRASSFLEALNDFAKIVPQLLREGHISSETAEQITKCMETLDSTTSDASRTPSTDENPTT